ncbi:hypothetical protein JCM10207_004356 [Rhodosporidiobolus poonsookiae]
MAEPFQTTQQPYLHPHSLSPEGDTTSHPLLASSSSSPALYPSPPAGSSYPAYPGQLHPQHSPGAQPLPSDPSPSPLAPFASPAQPTPYDPIAHLAQGHDETQFSLSGLEQLLDTYDQRSFSPSYAGSVSSASEGGGANSPRASSTSSSYTEQSGFDSRYLFQQHLDQQLAAHAAATADPLPAAVSLPPAQTTDMNLDVLMNDEHPGITTAQGSTGRNGLELERDATVTIPRRRAASPMGARQDTQRPFAFKRTSSGFSSYLNYAASPTSDLRTRPSTPAESATRSTFGSAISDSPPSASIPFFSTSPAQTLAPLEIPTAPALALTGPTPETAKPKDRPKGQGTLELERVLGMWAAKTPTSSFPNLPPLSSATTAPSASQPLFTQTIVASEPESFEPALASQPDPTASSALFSGFTTSDPTTASQLASTSATIFSTLAPPRSPPRRKRSKSEADIMRGTNFNPTAMLADAVHPLGVDAPFPPSAFPSSLPSHNNLNHADLSAPRPPSAPTPYTSATPAFAALELGSEQHELTTRERPSLSRPHPSAGGPGYHEAAFLEVPGSQRRARSQGAGHRRMAKSDDFTHLFNPTQPQSYPSFPSSLPPPIPTPAETPALSTHHSPSPHAASPLPPPPALPTQQQAQPLVQAYLANGQPVLVPASFLPSALPNPPPASNGQYLASSAYPPQYGVSSPGAHPIALGQVPAQAQGHSPAATYSPYAHRASLSAASAHSVHSPSPPVMFGSAPQRSPFGYHSPLAVPGALPSPPMSSSLPNAPIGLGMAMEASASPRSHTRSARSSNAGLAAAVDMPMSPSPSPSGEDDDEDAEGEDASAAGDGEYDEYIDDEDRKPNLQLLGIGGSGTPAKKAPAKGKKVSSSAAATAKGEAFTKESKTTQATIDAAKRRRNVNAVAKFVCELCGESFTRRYNLKGHQRAHKGEKPFKCEFEGCDKAFARAHDCKRHQLLHAGVRNYHCSPCKRDFVRLDALHRHHRSEVGQACVKQLQAEGQAFDDKGAVIL